MKNGWYKVQAGKLKGTHHNQIHGVRQSETSEAIS